MEAEEGTEREETQLEERKASLAGNKYDPETLEIDHVAEKKLVRKLDLYITPMVMLLYLLVCPLHPLLSNLTAEVALSNS